MFAKYRKAVAQVVVTVLAFLSGVLSGGITAVEWVMVAGIAVSALNTAIVPELDAGIGQVAKTASTFLLAGLTVAAGAVLGGLDATEWIEILVAAFASIGVTLLPNTWPPASNPAVGPPAVRRVA